jgi:hypothetical protein
MGERLHKLCPLCEKFQLRLRNRQHDWVFGHHSGSVPPYGPKRTHHRSLGALERSAQSGCHLCSLFAFAFKYNKTRYDLMTGPEVSHTDIRVGYRSNSEYNRQKDCEIQNHTQLGSLRVAWKDIELEFDIIPWPDSLSTIQLYREPISCSEYNRAQAPESLSKKKHGVVGIKPHLSCEC